jgi:hypothetical protein
MGFDLSPGAMMAGLVVSSIGTGYLIYGKKQRRAPQLIVGIGLMVMPMLVESPWAILGLGVGLIASLMIALRYGY